MIEELEDFFTPQRWLLPTANVSPTGGILVATESASGASFVFPPGFRCKSHTQIVNSKKQIANANDKYFKANSQSAIQIMNILNTKQ